MNVREHQELTARIKANPHVQQRLAFIQAYLQLNPDAPTLSLAEAQAMLATIESDCPVEIDTLPLGPDRAWWKET